MTPFVASVANVAPKENAGIAGEWVDAVAPDTEADPMGIFTGYLVAAGSLIG